MLSPNLHLQQIKRDSDIISGREGMICLDRNERISAFPADHFQAILASCSSDLFSIYPDLGGLYERLSAYEDIEIEKLAVGAGSDALIRRAFQAFLEKGDKVVAPDPSYGMYKVWSAIFDAEFRPIPYGAGPDFTFDVQALKDEIAAGAKICCIANPDQPMGSVLSQESLEDICQFAASYGTLLMIDEAYYPFHPISARGLVDKFDNVLVLRTFSKVGGIAGLRVGFAMGHPAMIQALHTVRSPGEVNSMGAHVACYLLDHMEIIEDFKKQVEQGREILIKTAQKIGFEIPVCAANFQLLKTPDDIVPQDLLGELNNRGYLIKGGFSQDCLRDYVRVTLDGPEIMEPFVQVLQEAVNVLRQK